MAEEAVSVARKIETIIEAVRVEGTRSVDLIIAEAEAMRDYDKEIALRELAYKDAGMAVTLIGHQAKGDASDFLYKMIIAQRSMKAHWQRLAYLLAQLNGYQSIYRHLTHT